MIGQLIDEVSIVPDREHGYKAYCRFSTYTESAYDHNQWLKENANSELVTIQYAGTVAVEIICELHGWDYERCRRFGLADILLLRSGVMRILGMTSNVYV